MLKNVQLFGPSCILLHFILFYCRTAVWQLLLNGCIKDFSMNFQLVLEIFGKVIYVPFTIQCCVCSVSATFTSLLQLSIIHCLLFGWYQVIWQQRITWHYLDADGSCEMKPLSYIFYAGVSLAGVLAVVDFGHRPLLLPWQRYWASSPMWTLRIC